MEVILKKENFREMPWKNGLGITQEIDIFPEGADFTKGDFHWRLSSARIKSDNSFSQFPGYDRHLVVLEGDGLKLNQQILSPLSVHSFHGEEAIDCSLVGSEVVDLGIIYRRDLYKCEMQILTLRQNSKLFFGDGIHYLKSISESLLVNAVTVSGDEVLKIEGNEISEVEAVKFPVQVLKISVVMKFAK